MKNKTFIRVWEDGDIDKTPIKVDGLKDVKKGEMFQTVDNGMEGPLLKAITEPYKTERGYGIKTGLACPF